MYPTISIGPASLPTYPLLVLLGYFLGLWFASKVAARRGLDPDHIYNMGFYGMIAALVGGRLGHVVFYFPAYAADPLSALSPNFSAIQPLFAALAAAAVVFWYQHKYAIPAPQLLDALAGGALVALAALALADGLNGRHFGEPSMAPWAIFQWNVARHPVQYYELMGVLAVLAGFWALLRRLPPGQAALFAAAGYAAVRLAVDAFRADAAVTGDGFRLSQIIAWVALLVALLAFYQLADRDERAKKAADNGGAVS